jgi:hypothetical protein
VYGNCAGPVSTAMSTIVDVDMGQVLGIVDGRDGRGVGA